ncbi:MAG: Ig-like domain-containing protein [Prevotella sp.]|nr:Ig-like domain-containing protein [Prevotella sp.]
MHSFLHFKDLIKSYFSGGVVCTLLLLLISGVVNAEDVTYTVASTSSVTETGKAPTGSSATYSQTFNTKNQITGNNSATLTLSGFKDCTITGIKLSMHSNSGKGAGTFSAKIGTKTIASIGSSTTFNQWYDNTSFGTSWRDVNVTILEKYVIQDKENVVIEIKGTANSLYIQSYTISYTTTPPAFTLSEKSTTINAGETYDLSSKITKAAGYDGTISYNTGDEKVATVNDGVITGVGKGTTNITIKASAKGDFAEHSETFAITVEEQDLRNDPAFSWSSASYEPYFDTENKIFPTLNKAEEFNEAITYSSINENVATINANGEITILSAGETTITASFTGNENWKESTASYTLNIKKHITELSFGTETTYNVNLGETFNSPKATAATKNNKEYDGTITYGSSDANIAEVNAETGDVEIKGAGTVTITATAAATEAWTEATASYTLKIVDPNAPTELFYESFDKCAGKGGNDNSWTSNTSGNITYDNSGWNAPKGTPADKCAKFGNSSTAGNPTTPEIAFEQGKTYILTLKCGRYNQETPILTISIKNATATLTPSTIDMEAGKWNEATITITDITGPAKINFTGAGRFFLDEIRVVEKKETEPDLTLTFTKSVYTTYVAPCDIELPADLSGYIVTNVTENSVITEEILTAPKGTPVIIKANALGTYNLTKANEVVDDVTSNKLQASDGTVKGGNNIYAMAVKSKGAGFYKVSESVTIPAGKAYLVWGDATANSKEFIPIGGETTGITSITGEDGNDRKVYYNLNGIRVDNPQKGIYIVNGKKVIF